MRPPTTPIKVTGGSYPAQIWQRYIRVSVEGTPVHQFHPAPADAFVPIAAPPAVPLPELPLPGDPTTPSTVFFPTPTTGPASGRIVVVPDVTRQSSQEATSTLTTAGFTVQRRIVQAPGTRAGTVVAQSPPGGSLASRGSAVTIDLAGS